MSPFETKNLSPRALSLFTALIISIANATFSMMLDRKWYVFVFVFVVTFFITYFLYYYTLERFIYRKIKLIYKFIYKTKATQREEFFYNSILPQKSIDEVSKEVLKWAGQRNREIEVLRENEAFRKEFLTNLAHELRTPIFSVQGYIETLLNGAMDDTEVNKQFLFNASKAIDRLVKLVDDLGEISQLEAGKMTLHMDTFTIQDLVREVFEELAATARLKKIALSFKKGTEGPLQVQADREKIRQVLINLIENAIKYTTENGTVTAGFYVMDDSNVYVEISDSGPGINEEQLRRIFERFYRADNSRSRSAGGTGLGLAIVKHIIEAHGHTVNARSKPGVGSSFGFTLNRVKESVFA